MRKKLALAVTTVGLFITVVPIWAHHGKRLFMRGSAPGANGEIEK